MSVSFEAKKAFRVRVRLCATVHRSEPTDYYEFKLLSLTRGELAVSSVKDQMYNVLLQILE